MNSPKRQHFIPRSYLSNFSNEKFSDKVFVYVKDKEDNEIKQLSTKDICVHKNLYTLPTDNKTHKFAIEHFYADQIDSVFPEIYKILIDKNIIEIDNEIRVKIILKPYKIIYVKKDEL